MRRAFLKGLALGSVAWRDALAAEAPGEKARQVAAVDVVRVEGRREVKEAHRQHQANPSHVWSPPAEYHEPEDAPSHVLRVERDEVLLTERPGFGIELDRARVEKESRPEA